MNNTMTSSRWIAQETHRQIVEHLKKRAEGLERLVTVALIAGLLFGSVLTGVLSWVITAEPYRDPCYYERPHWMNLHQ